LRDGSRPPSRLAALRRGEGERSRAEAPPGAKAGNACEIDWLSLSTLARPRAPQGVASMSQFINELIRSFLGEIIVIQA